MPKQSTKTWPLQTASSLLEYQYFSICSDVISLLQELQLKHCQVCTSALHTLCLLSLWSHDR